MATNNKRAPVVNNPQLIDQVIGDIQLGLANNLSWLTTAFGRAERLVKLQNGKKYYTPNVYAGGNEYTLITPDSTLGNFSFFWIDDPQIVEWVPKQQGEIRVRYSLIFWVDMRNIYHSDSNRNKESLKAEILRVLNGKFTIRNGRITVNKIYELAENIYKGFTLDEIDNQFLMHPYCGFRFEGEMTIEEPCYN